MIPIRKIRISYPAIGLGLFAVLIIAAVVAGCASGHKTDDNSLLTPVVLALSDVESIPEDLVRIKLTVTGSGMDTINKTINLDSLDPADDIQFNLRVPAGTDRTFFLEAVNINEDVAYEGSKAVDLEPAVPRNLTVTMYGQGYLYGKVYQIDPMTAAVTGPLASHEETEGPIPFETDTNGAYSLKLATQSDAYFISVHHSNSAVKTDFEAFAMFFLVKGGDRFKLDLYMIPKGDVSRPWICAMVPDEAAIGEQFTLFGAGFKPLNPVLDPKVVFDPEGAPVQADDQIVIDDQELEAAVPISAVSGNVAVVWENGAFESNYIPFTLSQ